MNFLINRMSDLPFEVGGLLSKMPAAVGTVMNVNDSGDLTPVQKQALADKEIEDRKAATATAIATPTTDPVVEETDEQIQAKLDTLATKEDKDLTEEEKEYIGKYTADPNDVIIPTKLLFQEKYGVDLKDKVYENSPQGLTTLVDEIAPVVANRMLEDHFASVPLMGEFYKHVIQEGKSIDTFLVKNQKPAFETIPLKEVTDTTSEAEGRELINNQKAFIRHDLSLKGVNSEDIEQLIELAEAGGKLFTKATEAKTSLTKAHQAQVNAQLKAEEDRIEQDRLDQIAIDKQVQGMLDKNDFDGLSIPPAEVKLFKDALFKTDSQGRSLLDYKRAKLTLGQRIYLDYLVFKDLKGTGYTKAPTQNKTFTFKKANEDNNSRNGGRVRGAGNGQNSGTPPNFNMNDFLNNLKTA